jgi:hypothetical protein
MLFDNASIHFGATLGGFRASLVGIWTSSLSIEDALNGSWASLDKKQDAYDENQDSLNKK